MTPDNDMTLLESALELAARGIPVFPCKANKAPCCVGGFKSATRDPGRLRSLFGHSEARLIGMPTGPASGLVVVDIDPRHGGNDWLASVADQLPATRRHSTMSGGQHVIFISAEGIRNSAGKLALGVDVRGEGGYIVVPPSPGYSITDNTPPAPLPSWLDEACRKVSAAPEPAAIPRPRATPRQGDASPYGRAALDSACDNVRKAYDGSKHATLNREAYAVGGLVSGGEVTEGEAFAALTDALYDMHGRSPCADFRAAEKTLRRAFDEGKGRPRDVPDRPAPSPDDFSNIRPFLDKLNEAQVALQRAATAKPLPVSDEIMNVDGALKMFVDYCEATAISPQPFLALAAGICAIGALAGRRYQTQTKLRSNFYIVSVADSGGGKDHARRVVKDLFFAAKLTKYLGGEDVASGAAMLTALSRHPSLIFLIDEMGDFLTDILGQKAAPHRRQIAQRLKVLYSSAGSFLAGTEYADQSKQGRPRDDIVDPHACVLGTSTPGQFWRAIQSSSLEDGLLARFMIVISPLSYPDQKMATQQDPPPELIAALQAIACGAEALTHGNLPKPHTADMVASEGANPRTVPMTKEAVTLYMEMQREQTERLRIHAGTPATSLTGRLVENSAKLALVRAVSRAPQNPEITENDLSWGRAFATHCLDSVMRETADNVADSPFAKNVQAAIRIIKRHGPISQWEMFRRGWNIPERERAEIIRALVSSGQILEIAKEPGKAGGRPTVRYEISLT